MFGDPAAENDGDLVGLTNGSIRIQQPISHPVESGAAAEDQVVAEFDLGEEQAMLTTGLSAFGFGEEGSERGQPFLTASQQIARCQRIGQFLQPGGIGAFQKSIRTLLKVDALFAHSRCQPVMLIQADAGRERQVRAHPDEHAAPALVIYVEVVLHDPALRDLQMPAIILLFSDSDHDASRFPVLHDCDHLIRFCLPEVRVEELVTPVFGCFQDWRIPFLRAVYSPVLKLAGDFAQHIRLTGYC